MRETDLQPRNLLQPLVVQENPRPAPPSLAIPGLTPVTPKEAVAWAAELERNGIGGLLLFGIPDGRDSEGSDASNARGIVQRTVRAIRGETRIPVLTDLCLCAYTDHGQCGIPSPGGIDNDATVERYAQIAVAQAEAGADAVAPSGMMDGQVQVIRLALDDAGYADVAILAYSAKFASCLYAPFRQAMGSAPVTGDRRGHQLDWANSREALREIRMDVEEGADAVIVKPAWPCLDLIHAARQRIDVPIVAYQVSGEWAMIDAAARAGLVDRRALLQESLVSIRRAGADMIITYFASEVANQK